MSLNYYQRHLGDYARDTGHLTMLEHGAYTLLLDRYYITGQPIPDDQANRVARARTPEEIEAVTAILKEFFSLLDGVWHNKRADWELSVAAGRINAARENGKKGGRPPRSSEKTSVKPTGLKLGSQDATQEKAPQSPIPIHQPPTISRQSSSHASVEVQDLDAINAAAAAAAADDFDDGLDDDIPPSRPDPAPRDASAGSLPDDAKPHELPGWAGFWTAAGVDHTPQTGRANRKRLGPLAAVWTRDGVTAGQMREAIDKARADALDGLAGIAYLPAYADRVLNGQRLAQSFSRQSGRRDRSAELRAAGINFDHLKGVYPDEQR